MLQVSAVDKSGRRTQSGLSRLETELDLNGEQRAAWKRFERAYEEATASIEAVDEAMSFDRLPAVPDALGSQARRLAVRLNAVRRLAEAAEGLHGSLSRRQQARADRLLNGLCAELGCISPRHSI